MKIKIFLLCIIFAAILSSHLMVLHAQRSARVDIQGTWHGVLEVPAGKLTLVFRIMKAGVDSWSALMDSPDQGARDIPCSSVAYANEKVVIEIKSIGFIMTGQLNEAGNELKGTLSQRGMDFPISLQRVQTAAPAAAPEEQPAEPKAVLPPLGADVQLDTGTGILFGSLLVPDKTAGKMAVLIIAGSGPTDRDGNNKMLSGPNHSLRLLAEALSQSGISSLRYDKRAIGQSAAAGLSESELKFDDYINDALAWMRWLRRDGRFTKVGILGHSEGAMIGMVAAARGQAEFFISVAGPGRAFDAILLEQLAAQSKPMHDAAQAYVAKLKSGQMISDVSADMQFLFRPSVQPYLISLFQYDPAVEIKKITKPVLIIQGTNDLQVSLQDAQLLKQAKNDARLKIIEGMNHVLKDSPAERAQNIATYSDPTLPLAKEFVVELIDFLKAVLE